VLGIRYFYKSLDQTIILLLLSYGVKIPFFLTVPLVASAGCFCFMRWHVCLSTYTNNTSPPAESAATAAVAGKHLQFKGGGTGGPVGKGVGRFQKGGR